MNRGGISETDPSCMLMQLDKMARAQTLRLGGTVEEFRAALRIIYRLGRDVEVALTYSQPHVDYTT